VIITVWVDDLLIFATSYEIMDETKDEIKAEWETTDLGEPTKIVGIEITRTERTISISQERYIDSLLEKEGMTGANAVSTPLDPNQKIKENPDGNQGNRSNSYARLLGELQFLANATRPDIIFAVNRLASFTANPSIQHTGMLKRILRYLQGTKSYGITYKDAPRQPYPFYGYSDAAYANEDNTRSTSGYVFKAGDGAITWRSKRQTTVAFSSTEAEYVALSEAAREACWLRNLYRELDFEVKGPTIIKGDNEGANAMTKDPKFHNRAKHIATKWQAIKDWVKDKTIHVESCRTAEQTADVLTKPLPRPKHKQHVSEMGLGPV
jgi:hypothetical protein